MTDEMIAGAKEWIEWGTSPAISTAFAFGFGLLSPFFLEYFIAKFNRKHKHGEKDI